MGFQLLLDTSGISSTRPKACYPVLNQAIKCYGRMKWQTDRDYGKRNQAERAIDRYKRILGNRLHSREFTRQRQEAIIGCSILNKMTCISLGENRLEF